MLGLPLDVLACIPEDLTDITCSHQRANQSQRPSQLLGSEISHATQSLPMAIKEHTIGEVALSEKSFPGVKQAQITFITNRSKCCIHRNFTAKPLYNLSLIIKLVAK